ncbi:MAG: histidine kinase dimerization/phosphoacceptor domain -containing protein [Flavobacteriales bacterium]
MKQKPTYDELIAQVSTLKKELEAYRKPNQNDIEKPAVKVPDNLKPIFEKAEETVKDYFKNLKLDPTKGTIEINDQRYLLIRASALSSEFFANMISFYTNKTEDEAFNECKNFLFDIGHLLGMEDAKKIHKKMKLKTPIEKLSVGPLHFAYSGWAFVDIHTESAPTPDENFFLKYSHPYSFEADSWIKQRKKAKKSVCIMSAAYSSGWCEESFGLPLTAVEITCKAKGDDNCTFIMASPDKISAYLDKELKHEKGLTKPSISFFFERKKIEEKLRQSEQMLNEAQSIAKIGSWSFNLETQELIWSNELYQIFEIDKEKTVNLYQEYLSKFDKEDLSRLNQCVENTINEGGNYEIQHAIQLPNDRKKWVHCIGVPILNEKKRVVGLKGVVNDITEKIQIERELQNFFNASIDLLCIANQQGYFVKISPSWSKLLGYTTEELCQKPFVNFVHPDDLEKTYYEMNRLNEGALTLYFENRYRRKNGDYITISWNAIPDKFTGLIYCVARDVTDQKEIENELKNNVKEKEILLKEIHHRVKNNLQIISSLLSLQSNFIKSEKIKVLFDDSRSRIKSMAALHELLYQSKNFDKLSYQVYLEKLVADLIYSFSGNNGKIISEINTDSIHLNLDTAVPLSLIINEIITNSLKHAFNELKNGCIYIYLNHSSPGYYKLAIGDNGKGFETHLNINDSETLGLMLVNSLCEQLEGEIHRDTTKTGTHYMIAFKEQKN